MDAKSLMIGDWVMIDRAYPKTGKGNPIKVTMQDLIFIEQGLECKPIPLTPEILEKNGWKNDEVTYWVGLNLPDLVEATEGQYYFGICILKCVHELQHALRLCGLDELADNFKV